MNLENLSAGLLIDQGVQCENQEGMTTFQHYHFLYVTDAGLTTDSSHRFSTEVERQQPYAAGKEILSRCKATNVTASD